MVVLEGLSVQLMIFRLLLVVLLVIPAGFVAGQHPGCLPASATVGADSNPMAHYDSLITQHAHHGLRDGANPESLGLNDSNSCDLTCKVSCAAIALPPASQAAPTVPRAITVSGIVVAAVLTPHPFPLLRPPAQTSA